MFHVIFLIEKIAFKINETIKYWSSRVEEHKVSSRISKTSKANQDLERLSRIANDQLFRAEYCASATGLTRPQAPLNCITSGKSGKQCV